jgi:hypothetical protein
LEFGVGGVGVGADGERGRTESFDWQRRHGSISFLVGQRESSGCSSPTAVSIFCATRGIKQSHPTDIGGGLIS